MKHGERRIGKEFVVDDHSSVVLQPGEFVECDYTTFSGLMLERYFHRVAMENGKFTRLGRRWDRKGENEIDMVGEDEFADKATFYEIKR